jgi:glyoxylase-like metal-dependent hydrolase (beta-lactamase superfamily II)
MAASPPQIPADSGIATIPLPTPFAVGRVNCYLLEDDPLVLIDPGPRSVEALGELEEALASRGRRLDDVGLVLITHQHLDHTGLAGTVAERSGAEIACIAPLADMLADFEAASAADDDYQVAVMLRNGVHEETALTLRDISASYRRFGAAATVARRLDDGDLVETGSGRSLRVVHVPGHSPTDTLFVDEDRAIAFAGDHLLARISSNPVIHRPLEGPADPARRVPVLATYLDSLRRTRELDLALVLGGHGRPVADHRRLIDDRIAHHDERKDEIARLVAERPRNGHELARAIWGDIALRQAYLTLCEVLGHTDLLVAEGRIRQRERDGVAVFGAA